VRFFAKIDKFLLKISILVANRSGSDRAAKRHPYGNNFKVGHENIRREKKKWSPKDTGIVPDSFFFLVKRKSSKNCIWEFG
jgi:hypothetical protein